LNEVKNYWMSYFNWIYSLFFGLECKNEKWHLIIAQDKQSKVKNHLTRNLTAHNSLQYLNGSYESNTNLNNTWFSICVNEQKILFFNNININGRRFLYSEELKRISILILILTASKMENALRFLTVYKFYEVLWHSTKFYKSTFKPPK
jgi:hypothetical protein